MIGRTISHYKILEKLGQGGMGIVYKAEDTKLKRTVALKFLPSEITRDQEAKERFIKEAQAVSALQHHNICTIHEINETDEGQLFICIAYYSGETLKQKIERGPLKLEEGIDIAMQVAQGMAIAHEKGIIHRDVKPANLLISERNEVKILDFGLAKLAGQTRLTVTGTTIGTVAYMSPEQTQGLETDHRTDVWSLGVILYEMISGQRPFRGDYDQAVMYNIVNDDPEPLTGLRTGVPLELERITNKAIAKRPDDRYQNISELQVDLRVLRENLPHISESLKSWSTIPKRQQSFEWRRYIPWSITLILVICTFVLWYNGRENQSVPKPMTRFDVHLPEGYELVAPGSGSILALSRDGSKLVYTAVRQDTRRLYIRSMDQLEAQPMPGTEGGRSPFFSPDGNWIGFVGFADDDRSSLMKVLIEGGNPQLLNKNTENGVGHWGEDNMIIYPRSGLHRINTVGGIPDTLSRAFDFGEKPERGHEYPQLLPGGKHILFTRKHNHPDNIRVAVLSLDSREKRTIIDNGGYARYLPTGHLIYYWKGALLAVAFDLKRLEVTGPSVPVVERVWRRNQKPPSYSISENGTLVYIPGDVEVIENTLVWVDHQGTIKPLSLPPGRYWGPRLSPDGKRLVISKMEIRNNLWIHELERGINSPLTDKSGDDHWAVWHPDGRRIIFNSNRHGRHKLNLYWKLADGSGQEERLTASEKGHVPQSVSPDGSMLAYHEHRDPITETDIMLLSLEGEHISRPFLQTPATETSPAFSPDGRWIAYVSNKSGRYEIYVRPYPGPGTAERISINGGAEPAWAPDGSEIYYRQGNKMMAVSFRTGRGIQLGNKRKLFDGSFGNALPNERTYDISPDGKHFLMILTGERKPAPTTYVVVVNWFEELKEKLAAVEGK